MTHAVTDTTASKELIATTERIAAVLQKKSDSQDSNRKLRFWITFDGCWSDGRGMFG